MRYTSIALLVAAGLVAGCDKIDALTPPELPPAPSTKQSVWLNQNWKPDDRFWFHHASQGTSTFPVPYSWFVALEQPTITLFSAAPLLIDESYLVRFGFIPSPKKLPDAAGANRWGQQSHEVNPDGLPVGFARTAGYPDPVTGKMLPDQIGLTCAACHTGHLEYNNVSLLIDGGTAPVNFLKLQKALQVSLAYTKLIPGRYDRFSARVLGPNATVAQQAELKASFDATLAALEAIGAKMAETMKGLPKDKEEGFARLDALTRIGNAVFTTDMLGAEKNAPGFDPWKNWASITAPVKFPHTWNTSWFDWVQYDGSIQQPMVRNAGEAMGVSAKLNLINPGPTLYSSSIPIENVYDLEEMLAGDYPLTPDPAKPIGVMGFNGLLAPTWPSEVLGPIDETKKAKGRALYAELCQSCHMPPISDKAFWEPANWAQPVPNPGDQPQSYLKVNLIPISKVGTDPGQANILQTRQVQVPPFAAIDPSALCTVDPPKSAGTPTTNTSFAAALGYTVQRVVESWYAQHGTSPAEQNKLNGYRPNCLQAEAAYKARPLDGIWAVPPFLHNGSVPTIEDLLRPASDRPKTFCLGAGEYDPRKLGYKSSCVSGTTMTDTSIAGNLNTGHEFRDIKPGTTEQGVIGRGLKPSEREALIEYLKSL